MGLKTTFILHGGFNAEKTSEDNSDFYSAILAMTTNSSHLLLVPFAKDEDRKFSAIKKVIAEFDKVKGNKKILVEVADEERFIGQIGNADILYFCGGVSQRLLDALKKYPTLKSYLSGKIIVGESAGANVWASYFYSPHADKVFEGLGFLPFKITPHYKDEYRDKLGMVGADLQEINLREYEFKVFSQFVKLK